MAMDKKAAAKNVYDTICKALDARDWKYEKEEEDLVVHFRVSGDDLPMQFLLVVDEDRQLLRLMSPMPFDMDKDKRMEGTIAACGASYGLTDGSFDYDLSDGKIVFRMCTAFHGSLISVEAVKYMIDFACAVVDKYNDKFLALNKGYMKVQDFLEE